MTLNNIRISRKLLIAFAAIIVTTVVANYLVYRDLESVQASVAANERSFSLNVKAEVILETMVEQQNAVRGFVLTGEDKFTKAYEKAKADFLESAAFFRGNTVSSEQLARLDRLEAFVTNWQAQSAERQIALAGNPMTRQQAIDLTTTSTLAEARGIVAEIKEAQEQIVTTRMEEKHAATLAAEMTLFLGATVALLIAAIMGYVLSRSIASPINAMIEVMRRLADGDKTVVIAGTDRKDEVGAMAAAVEIFKQAAIEQERLESEAEASRIDQEQAKNRQAALDNSKAEDLRTFVGMVEVGFERLSDGDLTVRMAEPVAAEFEPIRAKFNDSVASLEEAIGGVVTSIGSIRSGLQEINTASNDLSQRTEQQAASLEETVAALGQVTTAVNQTAEGAGKAQTAASSARGKAEKGGEIVGQAVAAMSQIEKSSEQINQIISVIDEIAFQTNLLALNAGVEAARAGEA
ncbi:methyl-accepting chemotaxis protein, partial [Aurantimonas sp. A3-2-R12]|uniref:methyl-accepting chemotaxis protein n=1 Tax=Aurantimonas sp. A3-2-R12 TaxID=3114362 RepID=UPI002E1819E1|nr:methyl-accepting chemotaxis protein [Aurantimonas sp. A3-2-R12]